MIILSFSPFFITITNTNGNIIPKIELSLVRPIFIFTALVTVVFTHFLYFLSRKPTDTKGTAGTLSQKKIKIRHLASLQRKNNYLPSTPKTGKSQKAPPTYREPSTKTRSSLLTTDYDLLTPHYDLLTTNYPLIFRYTLRPTR